MTDLNDENSKVDLSSVNRAPSSPFFLRLKSRLSSQQHKNRDAQGKFTSGSGGTKVIKKLNFSRFLPIVVVVSLVGGFFVLRSFAAFVPVYDLKSYYPNPQLSTKEYLEGNNYVTGSPQRSVLWFEQQDQYTFKMYNAAPQNADRRCNYDVLSWWPDSTLRYSETYNDCGSYTANKIVYDSPIIFLPAKWDSRSPWQLSGQTTAKYYEKNLAGNLILKCTGTTNYVAKIYGLEKVTPNESAIRWRTTQTTYWQTGNVPGRCTQGYTTRWQEDYWLTDTLKTASGAGASGLRRTKGGNLDVPTATWDVWYDGWSKLPLKLTTDAQITNKNKVTDVVPYSTTPVGY